jgi:hypothetical protein
MSQQDVLKALKLTPDAFANRVQQLRDESKNLTPDQKKVFVQKKNGKTAEQIAEAVQATGGTATVDDVNTLFANVPSSNGIYAMSCC